MVTDMDLMQMQQRTISVQSTANTAADTFSGTTVASDSSANDFSKALVSALNVDEPLDPVSNPALQADVQTLLNNGAILYQQETQQGTGTERQDMPVDNSLLPVMLPVIMLSPAVSAPTIVAGAGMGNVAEGGMPGESGLLTGAMLLLKSKSIGTDQSSSLLPTLPQMASPSSSIPVTVLNAQGMPGLLPGLDIVPSSLPNKMTAEVLENIGQKINGDELIAVMASSPGDNISPSTSTIFNAQLNTAPNSSTVASIPVINTPLGASGWGQELGGRVQWMVTQGIQAAALHMNPPHLGPIEVRIVMDQNQASISFSAPHMMTRDALEASIPRLRDMLSDNGLSMVNVNVSSNSFSDQRQQQPGSAEIQRMFSTIDNSLDDKPSLKLPSQAINNFIDYYA